MTLINSVDYLSDSLDNINNETMFYILKQPILHYMRVIDTIFGFSLAEGGFMPFAAADSVISI